MEDIFFTIILIVIFLSPFVFLIGLVMAIVQTGDDKKFGLKMMAYSAIAFVIGFGVCTMVARINV